MKISLRLISWMDIQDVSQSNTLYILFKLEEIKKGEVVSADQHVLKLLESPSTLTFFTFIKSIILLKTNIGDSPASGSLTAMKLNNHRATEAVNSVMNKEKFISTNP